MGGMKQSMDRNPLSILADFRHVDVRRRAKGAAEGQNIWQLDNSVVVWDGISV